LIQRQRLDVIDQGVYVFLLKKGGKAGNSWAKAKTLLQNFLFLPVCITKDTRDKKVSGTSYTTELKVCMSS
jgi:hypothetical protein